MRKISALIIIFGLILITLTNPTPTHASWWNTSWTYKKVLTFSNSDSTENLTNFPVMVRLTQGNFDFSRALSNGADVRFVDSDDSTQLSYEIEKWDATNKDAVIWVKVPQIEASNSDFIYMYFGNSGASDAQSANNVWDSGYAMVQHMQQSSGNYTDSTSNGNTGVTSGTVNRNIDGQDDGATGYTAASATAGNGIVCIPGCTTQMGNSIKLESSDFTLSFWIKTDNSSVNGFVLGHASVGSAPGYRVTQTTSGSTRMRLSNGTTSPTVIINSTHFNEWQQITFTRNSNTISAYLNGVFYTSTPNTISTFTTQGNIPFTIGARYNGGALDSPAAGVFTGGIDELKVSGIERSASYIKADYKSTSDYFISYSCDQLQATLNCVLPSSPSSLAGGTNSIKGWVYSIMTGPHHDGPAPFYSDSIDSVAVKILNSVHHDDLYLTLKKTGKVAEIKAYSSFNGIQEYETDKPFIIVLKYASKNSKIAYYDEAKKRWININKPYVINTQNQTIATTVNKFGKYTLFPN